MPEEDVSAESVQEETVEVVDDRLQRALAELENVKKRAEQDKKLMVKYATEGLLVDLLPVLDNFDRATAHVPDDQKSSPWVAGIQYIKKNLEEVFETRGVSEIAVAVGEVFNPSKHEAIGTEVSDGPEDVVLRVVNRGYMLHDRMVRPTQVIVSISNKQ